LDARGDFANSGELGASHLRVFFEADPDAVAARSGIEVAHHHVTMIIDRHERYASIPNPGAGLFDGIDAHRFMTQMDPGITAQARPNALQRFKGGAGGVNVTRTRLPGDGQAVERGRDSVGDHLAIRLEQPDFVGDADARTWMNLALVGVAVKVDDA